MKIIFVNASDTFEGRINLLYSELKRSGHQVTVITSDYMHIEKRRRKSHNPDFIYLHTPAYKKNISVARLASHLFFSFRAMRLLGRMEFDCLYLVVPPNSQGCIARKFGRRKKPGVKIVMDIIDMWPESLPVRGTGKFPFTIWGSLRNRSLKYADLILTECNLYREKLKGYLDPARTRTVYWMLEDKELDREPRLPEGQVSLCYLGSINNIIDIDTIAEIIMGIRRQAPVVLKIIGDGEKRGELIGKAENAGAEVSYYGKLYGPEEKQAIFNTCHYGLNIMRPEVCVGLSMKSIEYFRAGLPVINSLEGDTRELVGRYRCGLNWPEGDPAADYDPGMRGNARDLFKECFCGGKLRQGLGDLLADGTE